MVKKSQPKEIMFPRVMSTRHLLWRRTHLATGRLRASTASGGGGGAKGDDDDKSLPRRLSPSTSGGDGDGDDAAARLFLHVGPSGDFWTGRSIFAAKHLQPGYVRSVELDGSIDADALLELLEEEEEEDDDGGDASWTRTFYDEGALPPDLLARLRALEGEKKA